MFNMIWLFYIGQHSGLRIELITIHYVCFGRQVCRDLSVNGYLVSTQIHGKLRVMILSYEKTIQYSSDYAYAKMSAFHK